MPLAPLQALAIAYATLVAGHDLVSRRVPNVLVLGALTLAACWYAYACTVAGSAALLGPALLGLVAGLLVLLPLHAFGWMGAGDVKFFASLGFLLGWKALPAIWCVGSLLAGVHALTTLAVRHLPSLQPACRHLAASGFGAWLGSRLRDARQDRHGAPYAAFLGVGVLLWCLAALQGSHAP